MNSTGYPVSGLQKDRMRLKIQKKIAKKPRDQRKITKNHKQITREEKKSTRHCIFAFLVPSEGDLTPRIYSTGEPDIPLSCSQTNQMSLSLTNRITLGNSEPDFLVLSKD